MILTINEYVTNGFSVILEFIIGSFAFLQTMILIMFDKDLNGRSNKK